MPTSFRSLFYYCWVYALSLLANMCWCGSGCSLCVGSLIKSLVCTILYWQLRALTFFFNSFKCNVGWNGAAKCRVWHWGDRITTPSYSSIRQYTWSGACELSRLLWCLLCWSWGLTLMPLSQLHQEISSNLVAPAVHVAILEVWFFSWGLKLHH